MSLSGERLTINYAFLVASEWLNRCVTLANVFQKFPVENQNKDYCKSYFVKKKTETNPLT